jgi:hypothetical protein
MASGASSQVFESKLESPLDPYLVFVAVTE